MIAVDGKDIRDVTQRSLRAVIGVVQQDSVLFNDSIMDNIRCGKLTASDTDVVKAMQQAHLHERVLAMPEGYNTVVGERGVKLSGGEKQRGTQSQLGSVIRSQAFIAVSIARALLKDAEILLLDEATASLDSNAEREIQDQLEQLTRGKTTITIAHRLSTISQSDVILVMHQGEIVETGMHAELISKPDGHYAKLWAQQTRNDVTE